MVGSTQLRLTPGGSAGRKASKAAADPEAAGIVSFRSAPKAVTAKGVLSVSLPRRTLPPIRLVSIKKRPAVRRLFAELFEASVAEEVPYASLQTPQSPISPGFRGNAGLSVSN